MNFIKVNNLRIRLGYTLYHQTRSDNFKEKAKTLSLSFELPILIEDKVISIKQLKILLMENIEKHPEIRFHKDEWDDLFKMKLILKMYEEMNSQGIDNDFLHKFYMDNKELIHLYKRNNYNSPLSFLFIFNH